MKLPFLKNSKWPRIAKPQEEKLVNGSADDLIAEHASKELMDAVERKDVRAFRSAMELMILQMFDFDEDEDAAEAR